MGKQTFQFPEFLRIIDDDINEEEQIFVLTAEVGEDVPEGMGCFLLQETSNECFGRRGATRIVITDNDRE